MFEVCYKGDYRIKYKVYDSKEQENGEIYFLIYMETLGWCWINSVEYQPVWTEEDKEYQKPIVGNFTSSELVYEYSKMKRNMR